MTAVVASFGFLSKENDVPEGVAQAIKILCLDEGYVSTKLSDIYVKVKEHPFPGIGKRMGLNCVWSTFSLGDNVKQMTASSKIFPIFRGGAISVGYTNLVQGDVEVFGRSGEAQAKVKLRIGVLKNGNLRSSMLVSKSREEYDGEEMIFIEFSNDLWDTSVMAVKEAISFLSIFMESVGAMLLSVFMDLKASYAGDSSRTLSGFKPVPVLGDKGEEIMEVIEARNDGRK